MLSIFIYIFCYTQCKVNFFPCKAWENTKGHLQRLHFFPISTTVYVRIRFFFLSLPTRKWKKSLNAEVRPNLEAYLICVHMARLRFLSTYFYALDVALRNFDHKRKELLFSLIYYNRNLPVSPPHFSTSSRFSAWLHSSSLFVQGAKLVKEKVITIWNPRRKFAKSRFLESWPCSAGWENVSFLADMIATHAIWRWIFWLSPYAVLVCFLEMLIWIVSLRGDFQ